jgi:hypothetical protein
MTVRTTLLAAIAVILIVFAVVTGTGGSTEAPRAAPVDTAVIERLDRVRVEARAALLAARTSAEQRTQARRLAEAYDTAARELDDRALRTAAGAFDRLARSVGSPAAFATARAMTIDAERRVRTIKLEQPAPTTNRGGSLLPAVLVALASLSAALATPRRRIVVQVPIPESRRLPPAPIDLTPKGLPAWDAPPGDLGPA